MNTKSWVKRFLAIPLAISLGLGNATVVFAQEAATLDSSTTSISGESAGDTEESTSVGNLSLDSILTEGPNEDLTNSYNRETPGFGRISDPLNSSSGSYTYQIPIKVPPGRNGMNPDLALSYSSQLHGDNDIFGYGWQISIPYIERYNKTGLSDLYATSTTSFYSSLSGELVPAAVNGVAPTLVTDVFYPTKDGAIYKIAFGTNTWSAVRGASVGTSVLSGESDAVGTYGCNFDDANDWMKRAVFIFDTSAIPTSDLISSANLNLFVTATHVYSDLEGTSGKLVITHPTVSSTGSLTTSDYSAVSESLNNPLEGASRYYIPYISTSAYNSFLLNDLGKSWIGQGNGGVTKLGIRDSWDVDNGCGFITDDWITARFSDYSGTSYDPKLVVTHIPQVEQYVARNDDGSSLKYVFQNNIWTVTDKSGRQYLFGTSTDARQDNSNNPNNTYKWMLQEVIDTNGNYIRYSYSKDSGQIYPSSITYTGTATTTGAFSVDFTKSLRAIAAATTTDTGFNVKTKYKIDQIAAKFNGNIVHKYDLSYGSGDNGSRLTLSSITETGQQEGGGTTLALPATSFTYSTSTKSYSTPNWSVPANISDHFVNNNKDNGVIVADVNGDGLADLVQAHKVIDSLGAITMYKKVDINSGSGWTEDPNWAFPTCTFTTLNNGYLRDGSGRLVDVNGDNLPDYICDTSVFINNGHTWSATSTIWNLPVSIVYPGSDMSYGVKFADINGDKLVDILQAFKLSTDANPDHDKNYRRVFLNTGLGWQYDPSFAIPSAVTFGVLYGSYTDNEIQMIDVNNDGLADLLDGTKVYMNTGSGWTHDPSWNTPISIKGIGQRIFDVNGDNLPDLVSASSTRAAGGSLVWKNNQVYLNTGTGWSLDNGRSMTYPFEINGEDTGGRVADLNGDGVNDIIYNGVGTVGLSWSYDVQQFSQSNQPDLIKRIDESSGKVVSVSYKGSAQYRDGSNNLLNSSLPFSVTTVQSIQSYDGLATTTTETYSYNDGSFYFASSTDRRFAGFGSITRIDTAGNTSKLFYHQGNDTASTSGEYADDQSKIGRVYRTEDRDVSGNLYSLTVNKWDMYNRGGLGRFVQLASTTVLDYDGNAGHKDRAEEFAYSTSTGSMTQKIEWGEVTGSTDGSFTDTGTDKRITDISYAASTTGYLVLPSNQTMTDQNGNKVTENKFYYDNLSLGSVSSGNLTKLESWKESSTYVNTQKTYNSYGLVTQSTDPRGKTTSYTYDSYLLYPATTTNPLSQSTGYTYDYSSGKVTQTIDPNSYVFQTVLDPLDRVTEEKQPDQTTPSSLVTKTAYTYTDNTMPRVVQKTSYLDGSNSNSTYTYLDGLGRKVEERTRAEDTDTYSTKDYTYDTRGNLKTESLPFSSTGTSYTGQSSPAASTLLITYTYDPLKRVTGIANSVGTTANAYDDWKLTVTDPNGKVKYLYKDAFGRLAKVEEINSGSTYTTTYEYNGNGNLTKITDAEANIRNFTYDGLGRRLTAQDLHDSGDGTFGTWTYTYDDAGNMLTQTDPKSQEVDFTYDDTNRPLTENYTGLAGTEITYGYDWCAGGKGRLCSATTTDVVTKNEFNALGLLKKETKTINSTDYITQYSYDRAGNTTSIIYPDSSEVAYTYNSGNLLEKVEQKESGGTFSNIISDFDYSPTGKATYKEFANGVKSYYTYDPAKLYRLSNIYTSASTTIAGGGLSFLDSSNLNRLLVQAGSDPLVPFKLLAINSFSRLSLEELNEPTPEVQTEQPAPVTEENNTTTTTEESLPPSVPPEEVPIVEPISTSTETISTTTEVIEATTTPVAEPQQEVASTTDTIESAELEPSDVRLKLKAPKEDLLDSHEIRPGVVSYAYITSQDIDTLPASEEVSKKAAEAGLILGEEIKEQRTPNSKTYATDKKDMYITEFIAGSPQYYKDEQGKWWQVDYGTTTKESFDLQTKPEGIIENVVSFFKNIFAKVAFATSDTVYSTKDGGILAGPTSWSTARSQSSANYGPYTDSDRCVQVRPDAYIARCVFAIPTGDVISTSHTVISASLSIYVSYIGVGDNDGKDQLVLTHSSITTTGSVTTGDYSKVSDTLNSPAEGASRVDISSDLTNNSYNSITLNSTGRGWVEKGSGNYTKLGIREGHDVDDDAPSSENQVNIRYSDYTGTASDPKLVVVHMISPGTPSGLWVEGQTNPINVTDNTPEFSSTFQHSDGAAYATSYQLQVSTSSSFTSLKWDSTKTVLTSSTTPGNRISDISYSGSTLASSTRYYWRIKLWDHNDIESSWSTTTSTFSLASATTSSNPYVENVQDISYTYDSVGNITQITDHSGTGTDKIVLFSYDDLHRLTFASTTAGSGGGVGGKTAKVLVIGGGGGGGDAFLGGGDGGGGGGGYQYNATYTIAGGDYSVTVGSGGSVHTQGGNSVFDTITATGGGAGANYHNGSNENGGNGGSGGGGSGNINSGTISTGGTGSQGSNGGGQGGQDQDGGGGGGGATSAGSNGSGNSGGNGGNGTANSITGSSVTYSDGGGGGGDNTTGGSGGSGGGGRGAGTNGGNHAADPGTANTGGGGGGGGYASGGMHGAAGGSGVVIISYTTTDFDSFSYSGSYDTGTNGSETWVRMTTSGTLTLTGGSGGVVNNTSSSTPYLQTYAYSSIGNITAFASSSATTTYSYAETDYANPHAPTSIGGTTLGYDADGNLTSYGAKAYAWDYRNRMASSTESGSDTTYGYDHNNQRVKKTHGSDVTIYPNQYYNLEGATSTKYIYAGGDLVASIEGTGGSAETTYIHPDHLSSTNVVTDSTGATVKTLDYYPYGSERISSGSQEQKRSFIGQYKDEESNLNYLQNRYLDNERGQFLSQDPVFWEIDRTEDGKKVLQNPQAQNSYSYAQDNPIVNKDPTGRIAGVDDALIGYGVIVGGSALVGWLGYEVGNYVKNNGDKWIETVQPTSYTDLGFPRGGGDPNDFKDPRNKLSTLEKVLYFGVGGSIIADTICQQSSTCKQFIDKFIPGNSNNNASLQDSNSKAGTNLPLNSQQSSNSTSNSKSNYSSAFNSASASLQRASAAISSGDYKSAQTYLSNASKALRGIR